MICLFPTAISGQLKLKAMSETITSQLYFKGKNQFVNFAPNWHFLHRFQVKSESDIIFTRQYFSTDSLWIFDRFPSMSFFSSNIGGLEEFSSVCCLFKVKILSPFQKTAYERARFCWLKRWTFFRLRLWVTTWTIIIVAFQKTEGFFNKKYFPFSRLLQSE